MKLPHFERFGCFVTKWMVNKDVVKFLNSKDITHCAYAIAISKDVVPNSNVMPYKNEKTIYIGSTGGEMYADRKNIEKNKYKVYTLAHSRMKDHNYQFKNPDKSSEKKYSMVLNEFSIDNVDSEIYYSLIIPRQDCSEDMRKVTARILEYEHLGAFIEEKSHPPFMNREFFNPSKFDDSLSSAYMREYKERTNTLLNFL